MITEDILSAVEAALTGLTTTGSYVQREQAYELNPSELPALVISSGDDIVDSESAQAFIDWSLAVDIEIMARGTTGSVVTESNTIRGEVHTALMSDYTLGISSVKYIGAQSVGRPSVVSDGDMPISKMTLTYIIKYRSNWANMD